MLDLAARENEEMGKPRIVNVTAISIVAVSLIASVVLGKASLVYDEPWYLRTVPLLHQHGLSIAFLRAFPGPAGPLYTIIQAIFEPITHLQVPGVRLVNCLLLGVAIAASASALRTLGSSESLLAALRLLGVPMVILTAGLAMTEMPAVAFCAASLALLLPGVDAPSSLRRHATALLAGIAMGLAVLGRQPLLLVVACAPLLVVARRERATAVAVFVAAAAVLPCGLFVLWGGLVPAKVAFTSGLSLVHGLTSCGYGLVTLALISPGLIAVPWKWIVAALCGGIGANALVGFYEYIPLRSVLNRLIPDAYQVAYGRFFGGLFAAAGVLFVLALGRRLWAVRRDGQLLFLTASALALVIANAKVAHLASARYLVPATPVLVLLDRGEEKVTIHRAVRLLAGAAVGLLSLHSWVQW